MSADRRPRRPALLGPAPVGLALVGPALVGLALLAACSPADSPGQTPDREPEERAALALFTLAGQLDIDEPLLQSTVREDLIERDRTALLDALGELHGDTAPQITGIEAMIPDDRRMVLLERPLADEGLAAFRVLTERQADDAWRVVWFAGPGIEWPAPSLSGEGLSSSSDSK